jgi:hypothetical protein
MRRVADEYIVPAPATGASSFTHPATAGRAGPGGHFSACTTGQTSYCSHVYQNQELIFMKKTKLLMTVLMASLLAFGSGCVLFVAGAAAGAGVAGYAWVNGEIEATEAASLTRTWEASLAAMGDLQFPVTSQAKDALEGNLTARNAKNTSIKIRLKYLSNTSTELHIRVGTFGDEALSRIILNKIHEHLQSSSGSQAP